MSKRAGVLIVGVFAVLVAGCSSSPRPATPAPAPAPIAAPRTTEPPATAVSVAPGEVRLSPGPFTDRVRLTGTRLDGPSVHGTLAITTDVSDVLALEVHAAFYDATGHLVGAGTFEHADEEPVAGGPHIPSNDGIPFTITATPVDATVAAAVLSIPVLVNE
ncbi:hypothetical protein VMT65_25700 [Nocardia sp. CDC153]|uniref:hypothetical protein n=1 Tax=Nocardia sp. CDC153 TaxID=3112167 RepID=UPI002DBBA968|nr:hypothetical protein [Nocardia sp. CDC153]MEC3956454.1 hypothetical protein [Nocardia sp. CDC153]